MLWTADLVASLSSIQRRGANARCKINSFYTLSQGGQLLHSCGPLFKIIRVCGPHPAKNTYFRPKIRVFSKKKGLQLESISKIPILVPKSGCSLKRKKKVFNWNRSTKFLFSSQNHSVLQKKKLPLLVIDKTYAKLFRGPVVGPRCPKQIP